eukprot:1367209-Rhodomonas_salina.1
MKVSGSKRSAQKSKVTMKLTVKQVASDHDCQTCVSASKLHARWMAHCGWLLRPLRRDGGAWDYKQEGWSLPRFAPAKSAELLFHVGPLAP